MLKLSRRCKKEKLAKGFKERQVPCMSNSDDMDDECIEFILCGRRVRSERDWTQNSRRKCGSLKKTGRNLTISKHQLRRKKRQGSVIVIILRACAVI
jgi:hypothetical protein